MEGGNLSTYLQRTDPTFFYATIDRVIAGLEWVYSNYGIIHRDIKPQNILLNKDGLPFVCDWGIGRALSSSHGEAAHRKVPSTQKPLTLTGTGQWIGTPYYSAPEQILNSKAVDFHADIYSIGCVLYEWEVGYPPFTGSTPEPSLVSI